MTIITHDTETPATTAADVLRAAGLGRLTTEAQPALIATQFAMRAEFESRMPYPVRFDITRSDSYEGARWAVRRDDHCLNKDLRWQWEPHTLFRTDEFIERCRFTTLQEAVEAYQKSLTQP